MISSSHIWGGANNQERGQPSGASWMRASKWWSSGQAVVMSLEPFEKRKRTGAKPT